MLSVLKLVSCEPGASTLQGAELDLRPPRPEKLQMLNVINESLVIQLLLQGNIFFFFE